MSDPSPTTAAMVEDRPNTPPEGHNSWQAETYSSPNNDGWPSINSNKRDEWSVHVYPHINTEITCKAMLKKLCPAYKKRDGVAPPPPQMRKSTDNTKSAYCDYLNQLSSVFYKDEMPYTIQFRPQGATGPLNHPTSTTCRPGIVALRNYPTSTIPNEVSWSHLEATGEEDSRKFRKDGEAQAGAFTAYHLQARPDLVSVVGIFVSVSSFTLFLSNASRVYHTPEVLWSAPGAPALLYAWMWRLYNPDLDPSITIEMTNPPTFTVTTNDNIEYSKLYVFRTGESIGRRTVVLARKPNSKVANKVDSNIVIKEQYIEDGRRFREGAILEKIHEDGRFPGVVRLGHCEYVKNADQSVSVEYNPKKRKETTVTRLKTRVVLKDRGTRLVDVDTPRKFLMGVYDLLEISRILYRKRRILHRDISPENVLIAAKPTDFLEPICDDLDDMCFSEYLVGNPAGKHATSQDRQRRLTTKVIMIDFDSSEGQDPANPSLGDPMARTGTPIFMARIVRSDIYPETFADLPPMPILDPTLLAHHWSTLKARLEKFPENEGELIRVPSDRVVPPEKFRHLPRYDVESVFWYLLWWCMQAQPAKSSSEEQIPNLYWGNLTGETDFRNELFIRSFPKGCLHSSYAELVPLLSDMRKHLSGDLEFCANVERRENPEYMHEVFQRLILNFLVTNNKKSFMDLKKAAHPRSVKPAAMCRNGTTTQQGKRRFEDTENSPTAMAKEAKKAKKARKAKN